MAANFKCPGQYVHDGITLTYPTFPPEIVDRIKSFELRNNDVVVATYPKAGTTWVSEIAWLLNHDVNIEAAKATDFKDRVRYMELKSMRNTQCDLDLLQQEASPRVMRTHLPAKIFSEHLQPGSKAQGKFIVVMRNPKDNLVSFYHFYRANVGLGSFQGTWGDYFSLFQAKGLFCGDWLEYNMDWWQYRSRDNVLFLKYEDLKERPRDVIKDIASFLNTRLTTSTLEQIVQHTSFNSMKENPSTNMRNWPSFIYNHKVSDFLRKGEVGDWKNYFTDEQSNYIEENYVKPAALKGLYFHYE